MLCAKSLRGEDADFLAVADENFGGSIFACHRACLEAVTHPKFGSLDVPDERKV